MIGSFVLRKEIEFWRGSGVGFQDKVYETDDVPSSSKVANMLRDNPKIFGSSCWNVIPLSLESFCRRILGWQKEVQANLRAFLVSISKTRSGRGPRKAKTSLRQGQPWRGRPVEARFVSKVD